MLLNDEERLLYFQSSLNLFHYCLVNYRNKRVSFENFMKLDTLKKMRVRDYFYKNEYLLDEYLAQNDLNIEHKYLLEGFRKRVSGTFLILKQLKEHAIFINNDTLVVYAVKALSDPFIHYCGLLPRIVMTTILPFKDKIIYDGYISHYDVEIEANKKKIYEEIYQLAKAENKIVYNLWEDKQERIDVSKIHFQIHKSNFLNQVKKN